MDVAERLRALFDGYDLQIPGETISINMSLGVAMRGTHEKSFDSLFSRADKALLQAKQQGRNQVCGTQ
jgi:diguanylate cyclase (GGDEF)-like protein